MAGDPGEEGKGFKVQDRRRFSADTGESKDGPSEEAAAGKEPHASEGRGEQESGSPEEEASLPINFPMFIISLSTQALMHLGEIPNPLTGKEEKEIKVAKQTIDIISLLREKTRGNLDQEEEKLVDEILFNLRMKYVEAVRNK